MEPILLEGCENRNSDLQRTGPSIFHHTALTLHLVWPEARAGVSRLASSHQSQHPGRLAGWPAGSNDSGPSLQSHYTPCRRLRLLTLQRQYPLLLVLYSSYFDLSSPPLPPPTPIPRIRAARPLLMEEPASHKALRGRLSTPSGACQSARGRAPYIFYRRRLFCACVSRRR